MTEIPGMVERLLANAIERELNVLTEPGTTTTLRSIAEKAAKGVESALRDAGVVIVPLEPTLEMYEAALCVPGNDPDHEVWCAMVAAAQRGMIRATR